MSLKRVQEIVSYNLSSNTISQKPIINAEIPETIENKKMRCDGDSTCELSNGALSFKAKSTVYIIKNKSEDRKNTIETETIINLLKRLDS